MSAPSRPRGRAASTTTSRGRASSRGSFGSSTRARGRGRGAPSTNPRAEGLLQGLRNGTLHKKGPEDGSTQTLRGRGNSTRGQPASEVRSNLSINFGSASAPNPRSSTPAPSSLKDFMNEATAKFQILKQRRDAERAKAIRDGFLADPEKKTSLDKAITPVGTCTDMCPEFERVERIVQNMVDKTEKVPSEATGREIPSESRMIKRFRRSAAGYDEQLPSDIRTPVTLKATLDYLLDKVVGGEERLASIHKFVWDRTRGIRNDFSIQQVSKDEDVGIAVDCFERIARFHILSLHQLSNPENLREGENFDAHQDREQLNNTLLSLIYYYDDYRHKMPFPNEAEFRAYCIIFELQSRHPDLEDRMQSWPKALLEDGRVKTAFRLFAAAGNTIFEQGPLRPEAPFSMAQGNAVSFWTILQSKAVSYLMACVGEIYFSQVRFTALEGLWRSAKSAPIGAQARTQDWTLSALSHLLAFDDDEQTVEFCHAFNLSFLEKEGGEQYLNLTTSMQSLDKSLIPNQQIFSGIVEQKRYRRTLVAVINGVSVQRAIREEMVDTDEEREVESSDKGANSDANTLFVPETNTAQAVNEAAKSQPGSGFDSQATSFKPLFGFSQASNSSKSTFGNHPVFGAPSTTQEPTSESSSTLKTPFTNKPTDTVSPISGGFGSGSRSSFVFNTAAPASSLTATATSALSFNSGQGFTSTATTSTPVSIPQPAPSTTQSQAPRPVPSFFTTPPLPTWQNSALSTAFSPQAPQPSAQRPPSLHPVQFGIGFPSQATQTPAPLSSTQPAAPPVIAQTPHAPTLDQPPPSPRPGNLQIPASTLQPPSLFPTVSSNNPPAGQSGLYFSQSSAFTPFNQTSFLSSGVASGKGPGSSQLFTTQPGPLSSKFPPLNLAPPNQGGQQSSSSSRDEPATQQPPSAEHSPKSFPTDIFPLQAQSPTMGQMLSLPAEVEQLHKRALTAADKKLAIDVTAQLALLQERGLMSDYVEHYLRQALPNTVRLWEKERVDGIVKSARTSVLSRKYGIRWRKITYHNKLQRRAVIRRLKYVEIWKGEHEKKLRQHKREKELEEILQAQKEKETIQEEQRKARVKEEERKEAARRQELVNANTVMGRKRKSMGDEPIQQASQETPRKILRTHRRSRTVGGATDHDLPRTSTPRFSPQGRRVSIFSGKDSQFGKFVPTPPHNRLNKTRTDYFRLKARGIDPESPIIPHTAASLLKKQKREAAEREAFIAAGYARSRIRYKPTPRVKTPEATPSDKERPGLFLASLDARRPPSLSKGNTQAFKAIEEMKVMLTEGTEWYKEQSAILQEEYEQQEEVTRRSASTYSSIHSPRTSGNGLAIAPTGYEYRPDNTPPGQRLNRTETRIRKTGARGMATAPIGGIPGYVSARTAQMKELRDSLSRDSEYARDMRMNAIVKPDRKTDRPEKSFSDAAPNMDEQRTVDPMSPAAQSIDHFPSSSGGLQPLQRHQTNGATHQEFEPPDHTSHQLTSSQQASFQSLNGSTLNRFAALNNVQDDDDELLEEDGEDEEDEHAESDDELFEEDRTEYQDDQRPRYYPGYNGDTEESYDELEEDEEEDGDEDASEEGEEINQIAKHAYLQLPEADRQGSYGSSQMSRATSGTGASVEDAFVLDSD